MPQRNTMLLNVRRPLVLAILAKEPNFSQKSSLLNKEGFHWPFPTANGLCFGFRSPRLCNKEYASSKAVKKAVKAEEQQATRKDNASTNTGSVGPGKGPGVRKGDRAVSQQVA
ncbi:hypothetical protein Ddc_13884 [Ditylenchus destructor]|nr:hypothetical protein Ddc_13884 [Ditylenchus destructor]